MIRGELRYEKQTDGTMQLRDDLSRFWCACGKPATAYFPELVGIHQFKCEGHKLAGLEEQE